MEFHFTRIFDQDATQEDIFEKVARPVVLKYYVNL
jgi:hypothetical protein